MIEFKPCLVRRGEIGDLWLSEVGNVQEVVELGALAVVGGAGRVGRRDFRFGGLLHLCWISSG